MSRKKKSFPFFLWHRRLGLAGLLLLFVLAITGIMLNHTEDFHLDETHIKSDLLLKEAKLRTIIAYENFFHISLSPP